MATTLKPTAPSTTIYGGGFNFGGAATISGGSLYTLTGIFFGGTTSLTSTRAQADHNDVNFEGNAVVASSSVLAQSYIVIGGADGEPFAGIPVPVMIPATGGGNATVTVT